VAEALVTRGMISWAIERSQETPENIARKLNVKPEKLIAWEKGDTRPSIRQAQELAKKLYIPFGYLYLSTPPRESLPLPDLRTTGDITPRRPSPNFLDVLYDAFRKQEWYREYLQEEGAHPLPFVGKFTLDDDSKVVAKDIVDLLAIDDKLRKSCDSWEEFLTEFIRRAERSRVLVLRSGIVGSNTHRPLDINEFRGFAISDNLAPLIFINEADYRVAQIFTLAHELAHLWIGQSGVSNPNYMLRSKEQQNVIDRSCDSIAAEVLVPTDDFLVRWNDFHSLDSNLGRLAHHYRVSTFVVLRRAYEFNKIQYEQFQVKYQELLKKSARKKNKGGNYYNLVLSRNSVTLTRSLILAASEGRVLPTEAARLLNIGVAKLDAIESYIMFGEPRHG
jgi:Zn-dependent peptidase ImmA (M78 family)/DNA-binding XRE family transcriptional regulator